MYLHLGQDTVVRTKNIIGIFDLENTSVSKLTRAFLATAQKAGQVVDVTQELPKSFVICQENGNTVVYITQISCATLRKRAGFLEGIANL